jgi:hypothetical protein
MFNSSTYVGTCQSLGPTWALINHYELGRALPNTFCNAGIYAANMTNDISVITFGSNPPQSSIVYTQNVVIGSSTFSKTQCYYCKDAM